MKPSIADRTNLAPVYDVLAAKVHEAMPDVLIFFAGVTWGRWGTGFTHAPDHKPSLSVLAFHFYKPLDTVWIPGVETHLI